MMEDEVPKPPNEQTPAQPARHNGCVCRDCGRPVNCARGEIRDHRFFCVDCLNTPPKVGRR